MTEPAVARGVDGEPWRLVERRGTGAWPVSVAATGLLLPDHFGRGSVKSVVTRAGFQCCVMDANLTRAGTLHASDPSPPDELIAFGCAVVIEGGAAFLPDGVRHPSPLRAGDFILHHSAEPRLQMEFEPSGLMLFNAGFSVNLLRELIDDLPLPEPLRRIIEQGRTEPFALPGRLDTHTRLLMEEIRNAPFSGGALRLHHQAKSLELLAHLAGLWSGQGSPARSRWTRRDVAALEEARRLLMQDLQNPPGLTELAALVGLSPTKMKLGFRQVLDTTVSDTLREARLMTAKRLLAAGELPLKSVAHQTGFCDAASLSHAFKARFGCTPGQWRRGDDLE